MGKEFKINNFDLLRILAASQVMVSHALIHLHVSAPPWLVEALHAFPGVPIFFVISGFLISASYERSSGLESYYRNRVLRIFPGLWCCVIATALVAAFCGFSLVNGQATVWLVSQLAGAIYTPRFLKDFGIGSYNGSLWTIPVELQFYFLLPVLYWLTRKEAKYRTTHFCLAWLAFVAIALAARFMFPSLDEAQDASTLGKFVRYSFLPHFFLFMTGVVLQRLKVHESTWIAGKGIYWLAAYVAFHWALPTAPATYVLAKLLLAVAAVSVAYTAPSLSQRILRGNDISYGVYIYHGLLINLFVELGLAGGAECLILAACTFVVAYLSWVGIERPFLRKKKQTISHAQVSPQVNPAIGGLRRTRASLRAE